MRALLMIIGHVLLEDLGEGAFAKEDEPRKTLLFHRAHPALRIRIEIWRPWRQWHPCDSSGVDELLKGRTIFPISVMDEVLPGRQEAPLLHRKVTGDLPHPRLIGMRCDASDMHFPCAKPDKKQDVIGDESPQRPDFSREEVSRHEDVHVRADELLPRRGRLAFWRWWDTMALENVPSRLVTDRVTQMGQGTDDPVVTPGAI